MYTNDFMTQREADLTQELAQVKEAAQELRTALLVILDAMDYTSGACRVNEMVGAVVPTVIIVNARNALEKVGVQP